MTNTLILMSAKVVRCTFDIFCGLDAIAASIRISSNCSPRSLGLVHPDFQTKKSRFIEAALFYLFGEACQNCCLTIFSINRSHTIQPTVQGLGMIG